MTVMNSRKKSPVTYSEIPLFFSLVDYRNNYFTSEDPNRIIEFYNGFDNRDQLILWMRERPNGVANIYEVEGNRDTIVVIPTADFNGKYARECKENIFKGLHIVFVESGEVPDTYFNYAHNVNAGIKKAMEYNPKWVVVSNDDMTKINDITLLQREISDLNCLELDAVFGCDQNRRPRRGKISKPNCFYDFAQSHCRKSFSQERRKIRLKFQVIYLPVPLSALVYRNMFTKGLKMFVFRDFLILSANFIKNIKCIVFDETYINDSEDNDLALRLHVSGRVTTINYAIKTIGAKSLGNSDVRLFRSIASEIYLNQKWEEFLCLSSS